ncbi:alkane 1-monooxygenase [Roseivivax sp. CAU 1761]
MTRFAAITGALVALLAAALIWGGWAIWAALAYVTVFAALLDRIAAPDGAESPGGEFPAGTALSAALGIAHVPLLYGGVLALAASPAPLPARLALFVALGLFLGQVSNSNAHELIHRGDRRLRRLGTLVFVTLLFGHHASAHPRVHHVWVATPRDPNSARLGEGFWRFAPRAWWGSFREGRRAETRLRAGRGRGRHPYAAYGAGAALSLAAVWTLGGGRAVALYLGLCLYAQMQLLLSDYVQHYGLTRRALGPGRWEPVGPAHSWNAPHAFTAGLLLNAPRHSDHHANPARPYPGLRLEPGAMPMLPASLPVMASLALVPPLWRRVMDRRARAWSAEACPDPARDFPGEAGSGILRA